MNGKSDQYRQQLLRGIDKAKIVISAAELPVQGLGMSLRTVEDASGAVMSQEVDRLVQAGPCLCILERLNSFGGVCNYCHAELVELNLLLPLKEKKSLEQLQWLARPCARHFERCIVPGCNVGLCAVRHAIQAPDGNWYCIPHYELLAEQVQSMNIRNERGVLGAAGIRFWKSINY